MKPLILSFPIVLSLPDFAGSATSNDEKEVLAVEKQFNDG